jgi:Tfp pilus assembly protein PilO
VADKTKAGIALPRQSLIYIVVGVIVILMLIFLGIMPLKSALADLDKRTAEVQYRIEEQKILAPFYKSLMERGKEDVKLLPMPQKTSLPQAQISTIPGFIGDAARKSGLSLVSASPKIAGLTGSARTLPVHVTLRGNFFNLRNFLINMGAVPYIQHIEEISIQETPGAREFILKILVAVG